MSPEAREALEDKSPVRGTHGFYPRGYPRSSPGFDTKIKPVKKRDWAFKRKKER